MCSEARWVDDSGELERSRAKLPMISIESSTLACATDDRVCNMSLMYLS
jgi:hypothetical protein